MIRTCSHAPRDPVASPFGRLRTWLLFISAFAVCQYPSECLGRGSPSSEDLITLEEIGTSEGITDRAFGDFDGDGNEEYLQTNGDGVTVTDFDGKVPSVIEHIRGRIPVDLFQALDITGDGYPEIFVSFKQENRLWFEIWGCTPSFGRTKCDRIFQSAEFTGTDINGDGEWDGAINGYAALDVNDDGHTDILGILSTGYDQEPRGIVALDGGAGERI